MFKKIKWVCFTFTFIALSTLTIPTLATPIEESVIEENTLTIEPRTDIKEWIYKLIGNNLYKRLYNYSTGRWETDWIFVATGVEEG